MGITATLSRREWIKLKSTQMTRAASVFRGSRGRRGFAETLLVPEKGADGQKMVIYSGFSH